MNFEILPSFENTFTNFYIASLLYEIHLFSIYFSIIVDLKIGQIFVQRKSYIPIIFTWIFYTKESDVVEAVNFHLSLSSSLRAKKRGENETKKSCTDI